MTKAAPYPADTRAKGWRFEVDTEKVKASDTWLRAKTGALRGALLLLWAEAWQQTPCGSLPDDDELLALLIDMPATAFAKHRAILMRGWWLAEDGRLYHDTIASRVLAMLEKRAKDAKRAAGKRERDAGHAEVADESRVTSSLSGGEFDTKHQAPSTREKKKASPSRSRRCPADFTIHFDVIEAIRAECPGLDIERETAKFRDWEFKTARSDWPAAWRTWMRKAFDDRPKAKAAPISFRERDEAAAAARHAEFTGRKPTENVIEMEPSHARLGNG